MALHTVHYSPWWPSNQKFWGKPEKNLNENKGLDCTIDGFLLLILHYSKIIGSLLFLPMPLAVAWVNRWTFLLLLHTSNFFPLLGTENSVGGMGPSLSMQSCL